MRPGGTQSASPVFGQCDNVGTFVHYKAKGPLIRFGQQHRSTIAAFVLDRGEIETSRDMYPTGPGGSRYRGHPNWHRPFTSGCRGRTSASHLVARTRSL